MSDLPAGFADLTPLAATWSLPTEAERSARRQASTLAELQAAYDVLAARAPDAFACLNAFDLKAMPPDATRLLHLMLSLAEIAPAIELYRAPAVPDGYPAARMLPVEPYPEV